jgi:hypothetical protein
MNTDRNTDIDLGYAEHFDPYAHTGDTYDQATFIHINLEQTDSELIDLAFIAEAFLATASASTRREFEDFLIRRGIARSYLEYMEAIATATLARNPNPSPAATPQPEQPF